MTTIVWRDGVLAADSRAYSGDKKGIGTKVKICRLADGTLFGVSSNNVGADGMLRRWVEGGCETPDAGTLKPDSFEMILVRPDGSVFYANNNLDLTGPLDAAYLALGSGDHFAMGAMEMGAGAVEAVEIACRLDIWSSGPVTVLEWKPPE